MTNEIDDPFGAPDVDEEDPFATPEDVKSGSFTPSPKMIDLEGRLLAIVPREFTDKAPKAKEFQKDDTDTMQDRWTVDVAVLDGGPLTFEYAGMQDAQGNRPTLSSTVDEFPVTYLGKWVFEQSIIGQLNKVSGTARPILLGRLVRGPQAKDRRAGKTVADITEAYAVWRKNPKGNAPRFSWQIDVDAVTDHDRETAKRWLKAERANGFTL